MHRVIVAEARRRPHAAALLTSERLMVQTSSTEVDQLLADMRSFTPHVVLVEVGLLTDDVVRLCEALEPVTRAQIVVCCEQGDEGAIVDALRAGARAVVTEPVGPHELVARVRALLRRYRDDVVPSTDSHVLTVGPIVLDAMRCVLMVDGEVVAVPRREFAIAELLMRNAGAVVSRETLMRELWGSTRFTASLGVQVGRLRARLAAVEGKSRILAVRGVGYRMVTDEDLERGEGLESVHEPALDVVARPENALTAPPMAAHVP